jgi:hypothetical protein
VRATIVIGFAMSHRANNTNFVGHLRGLFEMLGKVNSFDAGFDAAQRAAVFDGRQHFWIE